VDVGVGPGIGHVHLARVGPDVGEGIEHVGELLDGQVLGTVLAGVDGPVDEIRYGAVSGGWSAAHGC
jgi:hypothetical protein